MDKHRVSVVFLHQIYQSFSYTLGAKRLIPTFLLALAVLTNCANPVLPSGGNKDSFPPKLINIKTHGSIPYSGTIAITFDENISLQNQEDLIILSPRINAINAKASLNQIVISFTTPDSIPQDNKTITSRYLQILPGSILDLNEKNKFNSPIIIQLSKPNNMDTNVTIGNINNINPANKTKLKAYFLSETTLSPIIKNLNYTQVYEESKFIIPKEVLETTLSILFLEDKNKNNYIDSNEYYNIYALKQDSSKNLTFNYSTYPEKLKLNSFRNGTITMITGLSGTKLQDPNYLPFHPDTAIILLKDTSAKIKTTDEHGIMYSLKAETKSWQPSFYFEPHNDTSQFQIIRISHPIFKEALDTIIVHTSKDSSKQVIRLSPPNKITTNQFSNAATKFTINNLSNHIDNPKLPTHTQVLIPKQPEKLGTIQFSRQEQDTTSYILYLHGKKYTYTFYFPTNLKHYSITAPAGIYNCTVASDIDRDKYFTRASIDKYLSEEPAYFIENISINPKLENTIILNNMNK